MLKKTLSLVVIATFTFAFGQITELSEDFDAGFPTGWTMYNDGNTVNDAVAEYTSAWIMVEKNDVPGDSMVSSTSFFEPTGEADRWLITPKLRMGAEGNVLSWSEFSFDASFPDAYMVLISTTTNEKTSFTDTVYTVGGANPTWLERSIDLAEEGYTTDSVYVAFVNNSDDMFKLGLDSIELIRDVPLELNEFSNESLQLSVYPNPAKEQIQLTGNYSVVEIHNMLGQKMLSTKSKQIQIGHLPNGVYLVNAVTSDGVMLRTRFIKK